jgi:hypothetical protein
MMLDTAHKQWASRPADERFTSLASLAERIKARRQASVDGRIDMRSIRAQVNGTMTISGNTGTARFNHWTAGQFLSALSVPRDLLARLSPEVATSVLNDRIPKAIKDEDLPQKQRILLDKSDGTLTLRAFHGRRYERVWDDDVLKVFQQFLPEGWTNPVAYEGGKWGAKLVPGGLYAGDRDMFVFFIDHDNTPFASGQRGGFEVDGEKFHSGIMAWNSEVGSKSLGFMTFMLDDVCGNHYVWGASDISVMQARHAGQAHHVLDGLQRFLIMQASTQGMANARATFTMAVREAKKAIASSVTRDREKTLDGAYSKFGKVPGFTRTIIKDALDAMLLEEKGVKGTAYDWLAGFTAVARAMPNADDRSKLEVTASKLLLATK